jgi:hypothetical protein
MKYGAWNKVTKEFIKEAQLPEGMTAEEFFIKELAAKMIRTMKIEDLKSLFRVTIYDPESEECKQLIDLLETPESLREMLIQLRRQGEIRYEIFINI